MGRRKKKKKIEDIKLEKRGFHNITEEVESSGDKENLNNVTFSDEDSIREELRYKLTKYYNLCFIWLNYKGLEK